MFMKPFQIAVKNDVVVVINMLEETSSEQVGELKRQGFNVSPQIIQATDSRVAEQIYLANTKPQKTPLNYIDLIVGVVVILIGLYAWGFIAGYSTDCASAMASAFKVALNEPSIPVYKNGYVSGLEFSFKTCSR